MLIFSPIKQLFNSIKKIFLEVFIFNRKHRRILKGNIAKHYLKKYVNIVAKENKNAISNKETENYTIWQFWDKGIENAPEIVKRCVESVDKFESDKKHVVLDFNSVKDYIELPKRYYDLVNSNKMKMAHFSDIVRTCLLIKYGGCWIDSTILLTDKLPQYITNSDLFLFQNNEKDDLDGLILANYFIHSKPDNKILKDLRDILSNYWQDNNFVVNYFFYLHALTMGANMSKENKELWAKMPFSSFYNVQYFQNILLDEYNENTWSAIKEISPIHKLSFKAKALGLNKKEAPKNSYYNKLISRELE